MSFDFSVVIPVYNKENFLLETLNSVSKQTFRNFEIVIVDDGSVDSSKEVIQSFISNNEKISINYVRIENQGVSVARNTGIKYAKGLFIAFLDADDLWHERYLESIHNVINLNPTINFVATRFFYGDSSDWNPTIPDKLNCKKFHYYEIDPRKRPMIFTSSVCIKRNLFECESNCFSPGKTHGEDIEVWVRVSLNNYTYLIDAELVCYNDVDKLSATSKLQKLDYTSLFDIKVDVLPPSVNKRKFVLYINRTRFIYVKSNLIRGDVVNARKICTQGTGIQFKFLYLLSLIPTPLFVLTVKLIKLLRRKR